MFTRKTERGRDRELGEQRKHLSLEKKPLLMGCDRQHRGVGASW